MMAQRSRRDIRTLVVHTGGIGDFLLFCPSLKRLAEEGPVALAGLYRDRLNLAVVSGIAVSAHLLDDFDFASVFSEPSVRFASFVARFDRAIVWMADDDGCVRTAFLEAGVRDVRTFAGLPPTTTWEKHASAYYAECLGLDDLPPLLLPIVADEPAHDVIVHPGSGGTNKNWPMDRFAAVAAELTHQGRRVEWVRGPAEEDTDYPPGAAILDTSSVIALARHLSNALVYVGNDSGVTHLAAACGCTTVAIFGTTGPRVWAPRGEHVRVVARDGWPTAADVLAAIEL